MEHDHQHCWADFEADEPWMATEGRSILRPRGHDHEQGFLATVRGTEELPRLHPISVGIIDGHLYAFLVASAKRTDLERDGRYALHAHLDPEVPREFSVRGRARRVDDPATRAAVATAWFFEADETYALFEFSVEVALIGERASNQDWPPVYTSWRPASA